MSAAAQGARNRAMNQAKLREHVTPDWVRTAQPEEYDEQNSSESELEFFECVVCQKSFRSQNQFEAHERSKKHSKVVRQLRREMRMEDKHLGLQADSAESRVEEEYPPESDMRRDPDAAHYAPDASNVIDLASSTAEHEAGSAASDGPRTSSDEEDSEGGDYVPRDVLESRLCSDI